MPATIERKLVWQRSFYSSFGILERDQAPVALWTVLSINEAVKDCAAYQGIGPTMNDASEEEIDAFVEKVRAGGSKIRESEARDMFPEIEDMELRYRR